MHSNWHTDPTALAPEPTNSISHLTWATCSWKSKDLWEPPKGASSLFLKEEEKNCRSDDLDKGTHPTEQMLSGVHSCKGCWTGRSHPTVCMHNGMMVL